jgi:hypothetical protein
MNERELPLSGFEEPIAWLAQEIDELFDAGRVGLYEFIWDLNGPEYTLTLPEKRAIAKAVALDIMRSGRAVLYEMRWQTQEMTAGPFGEELLDDPDSFPEMPDDLFLALVPV